MTRIAALPMYDLPELRAATDAWWQVLARHLRAAGVSDVPNALVRDRPPERTWNDPALLFGQTCGFPLVHALDGRLAVVATPRHAVEGCEDGCYASRIVVRSGASIEDLGDLRGGVAAVNDRASHSGWNVLAATVAPHARDDYPFFRALRITGSHVESIARVASGDADVAAIDAVTFALLERERPSAVAGVRVLLTTERAPALPYVTAAGTSSADLARIRTALDAAMADETADVVAVRRRLLLAGAVQFGPDDAVYRDRILAIERRHHGVHVVADES